MNQYLNSSKQDIYNKFYKFGNIYPFVIKEFSSFNDKNDIKVNSLIVTDKLGNNIQIPAKQWQTKLLWDFEDLYCKVVGFNKEGGIVRLDNLDERHPKYQIGESYEFKIIGIKDFQDKKTNEIIKLFLLNDIYDNTHEIIAPPMYLNKLKTNDLISCKILKVTYKLHLKYDIVDPYFYDFLTIVNDKEIYNKYFLNKLTSEDKECLKLAQQYQDKKGFYIFTFSNKILHNELFENIRRKNYKAAIEINNLIIQIENWILSKGIINAFPDDKSRKITKEKVKFQIENGEILKKVLPILDLENYSYIKKSSNLKVEELYYLITFSDIKFINASEIIKILSSYCFNFPKDEYFLNKIAKTIFFKKKEYTSYNSDDYFSFFGSISDEDQNKFKEYLNWTYCQVLIFELLGEKSQSNLLKSQFLRYTFYSENNFKSKLKLLKNAFYYLKNNKVIENKLPVFNDLNNYIIDLSKLDDNPDCILNSDIVWKEILDSINENQYIEIELTEKHYKGFKVNYKGISGYLPAHFIFDSNLKNYNYHEVNWITRVNCINFSKDFNYFTCKQVKIENINYFSKNNFEAIPKLNEIIKGKVKSITEYGLFITSIYGDGLLYKANISSHYWDEWLLKKVFKINQELTVFVKKISKDKRIEYSLEDLSLTSYRGEYWDLISKINSIDFETNYEDVPDEKESNIEHIIELEKGFIFEKFAMLQKNLNEKINYTELAKQFFSNTKNSRSYLLNIYIDYFNCLIMLNEIILNYSYGKYFLLKQKLNQIKSEIQPKTIENYAESEKLIYFIEILSLFNEVDFESFDKLYNYIKKYSNDETNLLLKIIAKITLSNNLLASETKENDEFSCSNLKRIKSYISDGVFSLIESETDRLERELNEERKYWIDKINEDEGSELEFKSTFKTPVSDEIRVKQIETLEFQKMNSTNPEIISQKIDEIKGLNIEKKIIHSSLKTIAAFANTKGGHLLIGVSDDKKIFGLEQDYRSFKEKDRNRDGFGKYFDQKLKEYFGESFSSILLEHKFLKFTEGDILIVKVKPSIEEIFLLKDETGKSVESIYVRNLSSTEKLEGKELAKFIRERYRNQVYNFEVKDPSNLDLNY